MRSNRSSPTPQTGLAILLCLAIHGLLFLLLRDALRGPPTLAPAAPLAAELIESVLIESPAEPSVERWHAPVAAGARAAVAPAAVRVAPPDVAEVTAIRREATDKPDLPTAQQLLDSVAASAAAVAREAAPADRGFLTHRRANLPGRDQAIVAGLALAPQRSLKTLVQAAVAGLHGMACNGSRHDMQPLNSERLIAPQVLVWMDSHQDIGPDNDGCEPAQ